MKDWIKLNQHYLMATEQALQSRETAPATHSGDETGNAKKANEARPTQKYGSEPSVEFPSPRYFQTHFVFIEEALRNMHEELSLLRERLEKLENSETKEGCYNPLANLQKTRMRN